MNELIVIMDHVKDRYKAYEDLLIRRDQLSRDAGSYQTAYIKAFGDMVAANFAIKVECIKKKKTISYCRRRMNRGLTINTDLMQSEIEEEMNLYYVQLHDMVKRNEKAKKSKLASAFEVSQSKKIYRRLAKRIHPDINKIAMDNDILRDLWERITDAYGEYNAMELENLEALVRRALEQIGDAAFEFDYSDIEDRIERVERQINDILNTEPYTFGEILEDEEKKRTHKLILEEEYRDYERYLETLQKTLDDMLREEGVKIVWKMN